MTDNETPAKSVEEQVIAIVQAARIQRPYHPDLQARAAYDALESAGLLAGRKSLRTTDGYGNDWMGYYEGTSGIPMKLIARVRRDITVEQAAPILDDLSRLEPLAVPVPSISREELKQAIKEGEFAYLFENRQSNGDNAWDSLSDGVVQEFVDWLAALYPSAETGAKE